MKKEKEKPNYGTRQLFLDTLQKIGCQYKISDIDHEHPIWFHYQGELMTAMADDSVRYVSIVNEFWDRSEDTMTKSLENIWMAVNDINRDFHVSTYFDISSGTGSIDISSGINILFVKEIPHLDDYLRKMLRNFFCMQNAYWHELARLEADIEVSQDTNK